MPILINDILQFEDLSKVKVRFNKTNNLDFDPIKLFKEDKQSLLNGQFWNYSKSKSFKEGDIAVGFAKIENHKWLLFDVSIITKDLNKFNSVGYEHQTLKEYEKYLGRLIIEFHNKAQNLIRKASNVINDCKVVQILEDTFDNDIFPGYENINLSWYDLKRVINKNVWKTALENQKGIYLITDNNNGKMYIGSAYGEDMLHRRWLQYVQTGHGGNKELRDLEFNYIKKNFYYSILDIYKSKINDSIILRREAWWKETLLTRKFGYNKN